MFNSFEPKPVRTLCVLLLVVALGGCNLTIGGPESKAIDYVRALVEQPQEGDQHVRVYAHLPNKVVIEYARALHIQGVKQKYRANKLKSNGNKLAKVSVSIVPERSQYFNEREHTLVIDLRKHEKQGWIVIGVSTMP